VQQGRALKQQHQQQRHNSSATGSQTSVTCHPALCTQLSKAPPEKNLRLTVKQGLQTAACSGQAPSSSRQAHGSAGGSRRLPSFQVRSVRGFFSKQHLLLTSIA
jgi:hypothetical protein